MTRQRFYIDHICTNAYIIHLISSANSEWYHITTFRALAVTLRWLHVDQPTVGVLGVRRESGSRGFQLREVFLRLFACTESVHRLSNRAAVSIHRGEPFTSSLQNVILYTWFAQHALRGRVLATCVATVWSRGTCDGVCSRFLSTQPRELSLLTVGYSLHVTNSVWTV